MSSCREWQNEVRNETDLHDKYIFTHTKSTVHKIYKAGVGRTRMSHILLQTIDMSLQFGTEFPGLLPVVHVIFVLQKRKI